MTELLNCVREPPCNLRAEQALLGALLANSAKAYDRVGEFLQPHHFAAPLHGEIYAAICRFAQAGHIADPVTLRAEFENHPDMLARGGVRYLAELLGAMVGVVNAGDYGQAIHDAWLRRELIDACTEAVNQAYNPERGVLGQDIMEELDGALTRVSDGAGELRPMVQAGEAVEQALALADAAGKRASPLAGITTGFASIDRMTGGLMPGQMYVLGARPAMGKTGVGLAIAARAASHGHQVLFWSGEMAAEQLGTRLAAAHAGIDVSAVFRGKNWVLTDGPEGQRTVPVQLSLAEWERLMLAQREANKLSLNFDDRSGVTVAALRSRARRMKRGKGLDLLVVDYIGLMRGSPLAEKQKLYERMTEISRDLKMLAAELNIPILVLAQLNRQNEGRENKTPQLSDLRDTGALEQDAYVVMFLHRPHYYLMQAGEPVRQLKETEQTFQDRVEVYHAQVHSTLGQALVYVAKNRNGPTGPCRLRFQAEKIWFRDDSESDNSAAWGGALLGDA